MNTYYTATVVSTVAVTTFVNRKFANRRLRALESKMDDQRNTATQLAFNHGFGEGHRIAASNARNAAFDATQK